MNEAYRDDGMAFKGYRVAKSSRQEAKFFTLTTIEGKMEVFATSPGVGELVQILRTLDIPMLAVLEDNMVEDLVALQANNGLKLRTAYGQDVLVLKANNVEQVGRKIAKILMYI